MSPALSNRNARSFFDTYAADFDAIYGSAHRFPGSLINRCFRRSMMLRFAATLDGCWPVAGKSVLDVGCGPGHYCTALAREGAEHVVGIDFAEQMVHLARQRAETAGVTERCRFIVGDFLTHQWTRTFDHVVVMGFMDYVENPSEVIEKVARLTRRKAFFSFPDSGGLLAWQRRLRYRSRCPLWMYTRRDLDRLFRDYHTETARMSRDFFVTLRA